MAHKLRFHPQSHKKGTYVDGHEKEDVAESPEKVSQETARHDGYAPAATTVQ